MYFVTALEKNESTVDEHNWPALGASYVYQKTARILPPL